MNRKILFEKNEFEARIKKLLSSLEISFHSLDPYILACVHRSVLNEKNPSIHESNERLEFLGDAILELIVTEKLFGDYPEKTEGELTDLRSALVCGKNLANIALSIGLDSTIILSRGEQLAGGNHNPYILANAFEAFLGALYLDLGFEFSRQFVISRVFVTLASIVENALHVDPKSALQEFIQEQRSITPNYHVLEETGLDHNKLYTVGAFIGKIKIAEGTGTSKKKAEQNAADHALKTKSAWEKMLDEKSE
jgi:ribonuclease-3